MEQCVTYGLHRTCNFKKLKMYCLGKDYALWPKRLLWAVITQQHKHFYSDPIYYHKIHLKIFFLLVFSSLDSVLFRNAEIYKCPLP